MRTFRGGPEGEAVNGPVTVEAPDDVDVRIATVDEGREARDASAVAAPSSDDPLINGLRRANGATVIADVRLSAPPETRFRELAAAEPTRLRVAVGGAEDVVVLMQGEGGLYSWIYPDEGPARADPDDPQAPDRRGARELTFTLSTPEDGPRPTRGFPGLGVVGGWLADKLTQPVRALVLTFLADVTIDALIAQIEGGNPTGLVVIEGLDPKAWTADGDGLPPGLLEGGKRLLLMVHGTFSDTRGSFGQLTTHPQGKAFLEAAYAQYDAVLGFDHKTLAESVETNAAKMAAVLGLLPADTRIDSIAYSRGGLVYRELAEHTLPDIAWRKAVFVGCTNAGTHLASPENWRALADLYVNLLMAGAKVTATLLGGAALNPLIEIGIKSLGEFVKILPREAVVKDRVPGLASMNPDGPAVGMLNTAPAADPACAYYAISSNFEPGLDFTKGVGPALGRALLDKVTDDLWQNQPNDLVVDTASMADVGAHAPWMGHVNPYAPGGECYHTIYFSLDKTARQLSGWLIGQPEDEPAGAAAAAEPDGDDGRDWRGIIGAGVDRILGAGISALGDLSPGILGFRTLDIGRNDDSGPPDRPVGQSAEPPGDATPDSPAPPAPVRFNAAASMPQSPPAAEWTELLVTLSRDAIDAVVGEIQAQAGVDADPNQRLRLAVRARENCVLGDLTEALVAPPAPGDVVEIGFQVKGVAPGPAEVWVEIAQGAATLQTLVLQPTFSAAAIASAAAAVTDESRNLPMVDVRVWEDRTDGGWRLHFVVICAELGLNIDAYTDIMTVDRGVYVAGLYKTLEGSWSNDADDFDVLMDKMVNRGVTLFRALFPKAVQRALWDNGQRIGSIQVYSYSPAIPWEVCYLADPDVDDGPPAGQGAFLAELGLTRWISNVGMAPASLSLREGKALHCIPSYLDPRYTLKNLAAETKMLREILVAEPIEAHYKPVMAVLAGQTGGDYDLIHFACHGMADGGAIWNSSLVLAGLGTAQSPRLETLGLDDLRRANLAMGGRKRIVFLNACLAANDGVDIGGSSSIAQVLVERGAGLLVGALWSIADKTALGFAETFYRQLKAGRTVTQAVRDARQKAKADKDFTWLAYTVFGHPYARVTP